MFLFFLLLAAPLFSFASLDTTCGDAQEKYMVMIGFQSLKFSERETDSAVQSLFPHAESPNGMKSQMCHRGWGVNVVHGDKKTAGENIPVSDPVTYLFGQVDKMRSLPCTQRPKQFLINILAHGHTLADERAWERNEPHLISVGRDSSGELIKLNMTHLAKKIKELNTGCLYPQVAIMDMSCGSAETLVNFANEGLSNTCIVTGSPTNGYASVRSTNHLNKLMSSMPEGTTVSDVYRALINGGDITDVPKISGCTERIFAETSENNWLNTSECSFYENQAGKQKFLKNFDAVAKFYYREKTAPCIANGGCSREELGNSVSENIKKFKECEGKSGKQKSACELDHSSRALTASKLAFDTVDTILAKLKKAGIENLKTINDLDVADLSQAELDYVKDICMKKGSDACNGTTLSVPKAVVQEHRLYQNVMEGSIQKARVARLEECIQDGKKGTTACSNFEL